MRIVHLKPSQIKIPETRVYSYFEGELADLFKHSIKEMGIMQPILVLKDGDDYWLIDGYNRLQQAKAHNIDRIPAAVIEGSFKDVLLKNLSLNVLRGRIKPTEMLKVVDALYEKYGMDPDQIARESGLKRHYVEKLLKIRECSPKVIAALDDGLISVSHAVEIARVKDEEVQERLLAQTIAYRINVRDLHDIVDKTIELLNKPPEEEPVKPAEPVIEIPTVTCKLCGQEWPVKKCTSVTMCLSCFSIAYQAVREKLKELEAEAKAAREQELQKLKEALEAAGVNTER